MWWNRVRPLFDVDAPAGASPTEEIGLTEDGQLEGTESQEEQGQGEEENLEPYTPEEVQELGIERLDPRRIPEELVPFYRSMQADYTRKTQAIARERQQPMEPQEKRPEPSPMDLVSHVETVAKARACEMLGLKPGQFDEYDSKHQVMLHLATQEIYDLYKQQQVQMQYAQARERDWAGLVEESRASEPNFEAIWQWSGEYLNELPYKDHQRVVARIQNGDRGEWKKVFDEVRQAWYSRRSGGAAVPQVVSGGAVPLLQGSGKRVDGKAFGSLSAEEQVQALIKGGYV